MHKQTLSSYVLALTLMDPEGSGFIGVSDFQRILKEELVNVTEEELFSLVSRYDKSGKGFVRYLDFLDEIAVPGGY